MNYSSPVTELYELIKLTLDHFGKSFRVKIRVHFNIGYFWKISSWKKTKTFLKWNLNHKRQRLHPKFRTNMLFSMLKQYVRFFSMSETLVCT